MKINYKILLIVVTAMLFLLAGLDFYESSAISSKTTVAENSGNINNSYVELNYSDIISLINKCDSKFTISAIDKSLTNKDYVNMDLEYEGSLSSLKDSINRLKSFAFVKAIREININRVENSTYNAKINIDFFKYKKN